MKKHLEVKLFHRTQRDLATVVNKVIDNHWENKISEQQMIEYIKMLYKNNPDKFVKENHFTTIVKQQCGKRRLGIIKKILDNDYLEI